MKVVIHLTIEFNPHDWNEEHLTDDTSREIRKMVKSDALIAVQDAFAYLPITVKES